MSGVRRKTKYRKGVEADVLHSLPEPKPNESLVRVIAPRGGNLVEVEAVDGVRALCRLPNRFRKVVWIKRGTLLIVETSSEDFSTATGEEGKVKYSVSHVIFTEDQMKHLRKNGLLPAAFDTKAVETVGLEGPDDDLLQGNRNRRPVVEEDTSSDDDDDSSEGGGSVEGSEKAEEEEQEEEEESEESEEEEKVPVKKAD